MATASQTKSSKKPNTQEVSRTASEAGQAVSDGLQKYGTQYVKEPAKDLFEILRDYAHQKPDVAAMWCFGFGLIVGWKLHR